MRALLRGVLAPHASRNGEGDAAGRGAALMRQAASGFWEGACSQVPIGPQQEESALAAGLRAYLCRLHGPGGTLRPAGTPESPAERPGADVLAAHCMSWAMESPAVAAAVPEVRTS